MKNKSLRTLFSKEEKAEYLEIELNMLKAGKSVADIGEHIGISRTTANDWKNELISMGKITQKEIEEARRQKEAQDKEKNKETDPARKFVLERRLKGDSIAQIAKDGHYGRRVVSRIVNELEVEGILTKEQFEKIRRGKAEKAIEDAAKIREENSEKEITEELKEKVLVELKKGSSSKVIIKKLEITAKMIRQIKKQLIAEGKITKEEIEKAIEDKKIRDKKALLELLFQGYTIEECVNSIEDSYFDYLYDLSRELMEEKAITKEQIKNAKFERNQRELMNFVIKELKAGLNLQEIADKYEKEYGKKIARSTVSWYRGKIRAEGIITVEEQEEIEEAQRIRREAKNEARKNENKRTMG